MSTQVGASVPPAGITPNFDQPQDVLYTINFLVEILCIALVVTFVSLRIYVRACMMRQIEKEDWACVAAGILAAMYFVLGIFMGHFGGGHHIWEVTEEAFVKYQKVQYADAILYGPTAYLTKVTLLLILARTLTPYKRIMALIWGSMGAMLAFYIFVAILKIRICTPIDLFWDPNVQGSCWNEHLILIADTVMSVVSDLVILALPMPLLWSMQMPVKKKLGIAALLGAGGVATATSIVRLVLIFGSLAPDRTVAGIQFKLLEVAEITIGILCACSPAFNIYSIQVQEERIATRARYTANVEISKSETSSEGSKSPTGIMHEKYVEVGSSENVSRW
ncbi:integral membrane protein [Hyaloscypha finlandica]|nr:integral membrane protein [Hyaloscypha finlandica]